MLLSFINELAKRNVKYATYPSERFERWLMLASFKQRNVTHASTGPMGKLFLREVASDAMLPKNECQGVKQRVNVR